MNTRAGLSSIVHVLGSNKKSVPRTMRCEKSTKDIKHKVSSNLACRVCEDECRVFVNVYQWQ